MIAVKYPIRRLMSMRSSKKIGEGLGYGAEQYGYSLYGMPLDFAGIYRVRRINGKTYREKMDFFNQIITHTVPQDANRTKFAGAVSAWQALSDSQKAVYNKRAVGRHMTGNNLFISEYMKL